MQATATTATTGPPMTSKRAQLHEQPNDKSQGHRFIPHTLAFLRNKAHAHQEDGMCTHTNADSRHTYTDTRILAPSRYVPACLPACMSSIPQWGEASAPAHHAPARGRTLPAHGADRPCQPLGSPCSTPVGRGRAAADADADADTGQR